jgi:dihydrofolate reductase
VSKNIIVAYSTGRVIGRHNELPWKGELPADMRRFKQLTMGTALVMGRLTFESIGQPLPGRENIVVTSSNHAIEGCMIAPSLEEAYAIADKDKDISVIGGERIFAEALDTADRIYATEINVNLQGDRFFPEIGDNWQVVSQEDHLPDDKNKWPYSFVIYEALR